MSTETLVPNGAGLTTELIPWPAAPNWACVDEIPAVDTDLVYYVYLDLGFHYDIYAIQATAIPAGSTINSVTVYFRCAKELAFQTFTGRALPKLKENATVSSGNAVTLTTTFTTYSQTWLLRPSDSAAWTLADIQSLQIGVGLYMSRGVEGQSDCSQVYVVVDYTSAAGAVKAMLGDGLALVVA